MKIRYKRGYKYQLVEDYSVQTPIKPVAEINTKYINLSKTGKLLIRAGYASDGPSGLTIDTKNFMRGAFTHDALYQLMRMNLLLESVYRKQADQLLRHDIICDGMSRFRAAYVYYALRIGGKAAAMPENAKRVYTAP